MNIIEDPNQAYDIIGDIHGHAAELEALLTQPGYKEARGHFSHPKGRKVIFLGDYIDRGPEIRRVLQIIRGMIDAGEAHGILGNHEMNALCFHTKDANGNPYRPHTKSNIRQHSATLQQIANIDKPFWDETLEWFRCLPLWLNFEGIRAVHACWDTIKMARLSCGLSLHHDPLPIPKMGHIHGQERITNYQLECYSKKITNSYGKAMDRILCGPELALPTGKSIKTKDGKLRDAIRYRWWQNLEGISYREALFPRYDSNLPDCEIVNPPEPTPINPGDPITFFGHYAVSGEAPAQLLPNLACLDYGSGKGGQLVAYSWDGESALDDSKFTSIPQRKMQGAES